MSHWHQKVYKIRRDEDKFGRKWIKMRFRVIARDNYICQRCGMEGNNYNLTVHHIIPRKDNGTQKMKNLITLCYGCHDFVEMNGFDTMIKGNNFSKLILTKKNDWHKWVYGGYGNPYL